MNKKIMVCTMMVAACSNNIPPVDEATLARSLEIERHFSWSGLGFTGEITMRPDQTASLLIHRSGTDEGNWHLQDNQICAKWQRAAQAKNQCAWIYQQADGSYSVRSAATGIHIGLLRLKTDNHEVAD